MCFECFTRSKWINKGVSRDLEVVSRGVSGNLRNYSWCQWCLTGFQENFRGFKGRLKESVGGDLRSFSDGVRSVFGGPIELVWTFKVISGGFQRRFKGV